MAPNMTCGGKKSPENKDNLVLITTFVGIQANAYSRINF